MDFRDGGQQERWQEILWGMLLQYYPATELNDKGLLAYQLDDSMVSAFLEETSLNGVTDPEDAQFLAETMITWAKGQEFLEKHPKTNGWNK